MKNLHIIFKSSFTTESKAERPIFNVPRIRNAYNFNQKFIIYQNIQVLSNHFLLYHEFRHKGLLRVSCCALGSLESFNIFYKHSSFQEKTIMKYLNGGLIECQKIEKSKIINSL